MNKLAAALPTALIVLASCGSDTGYEIEVVSSQPYLVSGGDALVRIHAPDGAEVSVRLNGENVSSSFRPDGDSLIGLLKGLKLGANTVEAGDARLDLTNYPITGPIISGPHEQPFVCGTTEANVALTGESLGEPLDENCSAQTRVDYVYYSTGGEFKPLPPGERPEDVAETTTMDGKTVPFIVRVQTGTVNRAIYSSTMLHDPADPEPDPWTRSGGWNGKLVYTHGGGCQAGWHVQGNSAPGVLNEGLLGEGYAVTSSSLNVYGNNCSDLLASETHMMVKERFVESYGAPVYTLALGCSGGSYQSHQTADNYPGVFDGILVSCSFPDVITGSTMTLSDVRLLEYYFQKSAPGKFTKEQQRAVSGFREWANLPSLSKSAARIDPVYDPKAPAEEQGGEIKDYEVLREARYDPKANPDGFRATVYDHAINSLGMDAETGFAGRPLDNVGVQYGLAALNEATISTEQFLSLNEGIGGYDADANHVPARHAANEHAARMAKGSGRILHGGGGLATTPIIDYRSYTDDRPNGDIHMIVHQFTTRARLIAANGHADNQVMLVGGRWGFTEEEPDLRTLFHRMDAWLTNIANDGSSAEASQKVVNNKPEDLQEGCWDNTVEPRKWIAQKLAADNPGKCGQLYPVFQTPRLVAGEPLANDVVKCQLKPIAAADYEVEFTAAELARLEKIFPEGVCDWSKPDVYDGYLGTWRSFGPSTVNRVQ